MRPCQLRQIRGGWNERFEVCRQWIRWSRTDDVGKFLRRICAIDRRHFCKSLREWGRAPEHCNTQFSGRRFSKSQFLDPASSFTLVVSRLLPAALDRYPRALTG